MKNRIEPMPGEKCYIWIDNTIVSASRIESDLDTWSPPAIAGVSVRYNPVAVEYQRRADALAFCGAIALVATFFLAGVGAHWSMLSMVCLFGLSGIAFWRAWRDAGLAVVFKHHAWEVVLCTRAGGTHVLDAFGNSEIANQLRRAVGLAITGQPVGAAVLPITTNRPI